MNTRQQAIVLAIASAAAVLAAEPTLYIGGAGGVYFLAEPGELIVEVEKRDLNTRDTRAELRAILVGPDRRVVQEATIPDDGKPRRSGLGSVGRVRLSARVERRGVYALNVTISGDRYGQDVVWGFRSNCAKYVIETARGHRDARHEEPIVLASPERPADVCFVPRDGAFKIEVDGLPAGAAAPTLFDAAGDLIATLEATSFEAPVNSRRDTVPWRLHLPSARATIQIDGVTRWEGSDRHPNQACWTPDPAAWFPHLDNRWLLTPYNRTVYGAPGSTAEVELRVRNSASRERTIQLSVDPPARLSADRVKLGRDRSVTVTVACPVPAAGATRLCHVVAAPLDDSGFATYATVIVKGGDAPASKPIAVPLVLKAYEHENGQFGHLPDFPSDSQMYFDLENRPFILADDGLHTLREGRWTTSRPGSPRASKVAFDRDNALYILTEAGLLCSDDGGQTFIRGSFPKRAGLSTSFDIEQFSGHNIPDGPPPVLRYTLTAKDEKVFWRRVNDLELFLPVKEAGRLVLGEPILVSTQCIGIAMHSGIPATVVSKDGRVHIAWGEATDPELKMPGVPVYAATFDRATGKLSPPALVGYGPPANDVHNTPSITMDGRGFLHVLGGTHGRPFPYACSLKPNDAASGWTDAVLTGDDLRQTYIGMVSAPDGSLISAFRLWRSGEEPFPASSYGTLAIQRKRPGQPWDPPRVLIVPPFSEYSVYYHRLTIDRKGRLFISYDYYTTHWFYRNDHIGRRRTVLMSPDGGDTWKLAETKDFLP